MTFVQPLCPPPSRPQPALTRVARAVWSADPSNPPFDILIEGRLSWNLAHDQARAALTAIREPSEGMVQAGEAVEMRSLCDGDPTADVPNERAIWSAMIDHILNGGD